MNNILHSMINKFPNSLSENSAKNSVKQAIQEICLCGLGRSDFFRYAAFNGGTALRIFHGLTRFSEDLDFSLDINKESFSLMKYIPYINHELASLGIPGEFQIDSEEGLVKRGYVKGNCKDILDSFEVAEDILKKIPTNEVLKVKLEVDTTPIGDANFETKYLLQPYPTPIRLYDTSTLFSGKIDAVLSRSWKNRVKGRDLFDYLFYITNGYRINLSHLENRLKYKEYLEPNVKLDEKLLKELLISKFNEIDYTLAKNDVAPFIIDRNATSFWSSNLFISVTKDYNFI